MITVRFVKTRASAIVPRYMTEHAAGMDLHAALDEPLVLAPGARTLIPTGLALEILRAGKHLFLEKPCGITREECQEVLAASEESDRVLMLGHELRYSPYFQKIKALVAQVRAYKK